MGRAGSYSKRTSPSPNHLAQVKGVERQPPATRYQRTRDHQDLPDRDPVELQEEEDPNHRTKKLLRWAGSWDQRTASVGVDRNPAEGSPVGNKVIPVVAGNLVERGRTIQVERKRFAGVGRVPAVVEGKAAAGKGNLAVGGTALLAAEETVVVGMIHLALEAKVRPAAEGMVAADIRIGGSHTQIHPEVAETA